MKIGKPWPSSSSICLFSAAALTLGGFAWTWARAQSYVSPNPSKARPIFTKKSMYFLMPSRPLESNGLEQWQWSNDGKYLLVLRSSSLTDVSTLEEAIAELGTNKRPDFNRNFVLESYDQETGQTKPVWQGQDVILSDLTPVGKHHFLAVAARLLSPLKAGTIPDLAYSAVSIDAQARKWRVLPDYQDIKSNIVIQPSPSADLAVLSTSPLAQGPSIAFDTAISATPSPSAPSDPTAPVIVSGSPPQPTEATKGARGEETPGQSSLVTGEGQTINRWPVTLSSYLEWTANGEKFFWKRRNRQTKVMTYWTLDAKGAAQPMPEPPVAYVAPKNASDIETLQVTFSAVDRKHYGQLSGLYVHSLGRKRSRDVLLAAGGDSPEVSPRGDAIAYRVDHQLKIAKLLKVTPELFDRIKKALQTEAMNNAKQAGLGLIMYSNDYDDILPGGADGIQSLVPYLKNQSVLDDFNFTPPPNLNMSQLAAATTQLGFVDGPDGQAIVYADGHVVWVGDDSD